METYKKLGLEFTAKYESKIKVGGNPTENPTEISAKITQKEKK